LDEILSNKNRYYYRYYYGFNIGNKRKKISMVWKYFKKSKDQKLAKCISCGYEFKTNDNISNLADHLKRFQPSVIIKDNFEKVSIQSTSITSNSNLNSVRSSYWSINPVFRRSLHYESSSQRKKELDKALIMIIAIDLQSFNIVNNVGFKKFINCLDLKASLQ